MLSTSVLAHVGNERLVIGTSVDERETTSCEPLSIFSAHRFAVRERSTEAFRAMK